MRFRTTTAFCWRSLFFSWCPAQGRLRSSTLQRENGIGAGLGAVFGTLVGDLAYMIAAVAGLAAVMRANPLVFEALQWFGAAYLCWMGIQLLRAKIQSDDARADPKRTGWIYFRQALAVSLTNPKVILFFVAFFPLLLRADSSISALVAMMAHVTALSLLYQVGLVLVGNVVANRMQSYPPARRIATRLAGVALIAFSVKLAASNR